MADTQNQIHVLLVDDEPDVIDVFSHWLDKKYRTGTASSGEEALQYLEEHDDVDIVFLDRCMPIMSGDEVLKEIKANNYDCKISMLTAVNPEEDIIDMGFDEYLTKPATKEDLYAVVDSLLSEEKPSLREYYSLLSKQAALQNEFPSGILEDKEEYQELLTEIETLEEQLGDKTESINAPENLG